jgi:hypothetical protein
MGRHAVVILFIALGCTAARANGVAQDRAHYEQAIREKTSAPYFILVTVVDDTTKTSWTGCTLPEFLAGALDAERGQPNDDADMARDDQAMLDAKDHAFHFSNPKALAEIRMDAYTPADLERARAYLRTHGTAFLLSSDWTKIDAANALNRTALACAIIEKGLAARMADGNGETFAEP